MFTLILAGFAVVGLATLIGLIYLRLTGGEDDRRIDRD
jgi:hypothetical protein